MYSIIDRMPAKRQEAFSLIEVLITIAIIGIVTAIVVIKYGAFNSSVLLKGQAYELALNLREAQVFSIGARGENSTFRDAYGLYFDSSTPNQYTLFLDRDDDARYDSGEAVDTPFIIDPRFLISRICVNSCSGSVSQLSVSFERPDFDARLYAPGAGTVTSARIEITAATDPSVVRAVVISSAGQISVE